MGCYLLSEIVSEMSALTASRDQRLVSEIPESLPVIKGDEERLRQVVTNLMNNAIKFTSGGGMITVHARQEDDSIIVEIHDTGMGFTEAEQSRLFQPYERVEGDRQKLSGLGLGLALSKNLVDLHGGEIWVKSRKGKGSTFGFSIPIDGPGDIPVKKE